MKHLNRILLGLFVLAVVFTPIILWPMAMSFIFAGIAITMAIGVLVYAIGDILLGEGDIL